MLVLLSGCSALTPVAVPIEVTHDSHVTQHEPFTSHPTNYGIDTVSVGLKWEPLSHATVVLEDGVILEHFNPELPGYGSFAGPREIFTARVTYEIPLKEP